MAKGGKKIQREEKKVEQAVDHLTRRVCYRCGQPIHLSELLPVKDGLRNRMRYYHKKCFA
ncbi:hypothetical protein [Thermoflexus hugenholtzii]|jgi:hypothetical protein|uniref:Uncharacterized protein n=1 Tax=Thermoflexus hugenholtzii JAD2 TaxID=877466 RepID=A0A212R8T1_9CHLR|nr:hypothetical protein [Thermoflexus hugenholtzii]SNB68542.1 hypothetical protein SAMN02746019_00014000 [Thermoflexus hugenholtzii JAD2]